VPSARNAEMNASLAHGKMSAAVARRARQRRAQTRARALSIRALPTHVPPVGCRSPLVYYTCPVAGPWDAFLGLHGPATGTVPLYFCHDGPATGTVLSRYRYRASRLGDRVLFLWRPTHEILRRE
jgi:hypothetical protein